MKTTYVTKQQLMADYVTRFEFNEFKEEMRDFRDETTQRFDGIDKRLDGIEARLNGHDKRFNSIDRKLDDIEENVRRTIGSALDQLTHNLKIGLEFMMDVREGKKSRSDPFPF